MKNKFEKPELVIVLFEDDLITISDPTATSENDEYEHGI